MNTADISIHNVTSIVVSERRFHESPTNSFFTRDIVITNDRGESVTICVYSCRDADEETAIKVQS